MTCKASRSFATPTTTPLLQFLRIAPLSRCSTPDFRLLRRNQQRIRLLYKLLMGLLLPHHLRSKSASLRNTSLRAASGTYCQGLPQIRIPRLDKFEFARTLGVLEYLEEDTAGLGDRGFVGGFDVREEE